MKRNHSRTGGALAGVLVAILILAALAVVGVFMAGMYFAENIHVEKTRGAHGDETVKVDTPIGSMRVKGLQKLDPKLIGVPVYPGAIREDENGGGASFEFDFDSTHEEFAVMAARINVEGMRNVAAGKKFIQLTRTRVESARVFS